MAAEPSPLPYRAEVERDGCEHCGAGKQWEVYDRNDVGVGGMTFDDREEAEHLAEMLNDAYGHGQKSLLAALQSLANEASGFLAMAHRTTHGNTNIAVLQHHIDNARAALAQAEGRE